MLTFSNIRRYSILRFHDSDSPARGKVLAKTGTYIDSNQINAQTLAGYIDARSVSTIF